MNRRAADAKIYFVRHGESETNREKVIAGWTDSPLTKRGIAQAKEEAEMIAAQGVVVHTIFSSPLSRAYDTAAIIARSVGYTEQEIVILDELREKGAGEFEGRTADELYAASDDEALHAGVELFDDFALRVRRVNTVIAERAMGATLVVGHSGFYRMALCLHRGMLPAEMVKVDKPANSKLLEYPLSL